MALIKRTTSAPPLALALMLFLIVTMPSLQVANGSSHVPSLQIANCSSQTFQLTPEAYQGIFSVELQVGDRIEGFFTINNLGPYRNLLYGTLDTYWINVWLEDPDNQVVLKYTHTSGNSFNYTATKGGDYAFWAFCSGNAFFENAKIPEIIFELNVLEAVPTRINVLSPLNQTYYESSVSLNFTTNKPLSWAGYSLDGKDNVTIHSNTTLRGLSNGLHKITVYANNTYGNLVDSETIFFTVEAFPIISVAVSAVVVVVAVVGAGLLFFYFTHVKRSKRSN